jgi:hypothetical protein
MQTVAPEADDDGRVTGIYAVRNPDKLRHLQIAPQGTVPMSSAADPR